MTQKDRMEKGLWYDANCDREILAMRDVADDLCFQLNTTRPGDVEKR